MYLLCKIYGLVNFICLCFLAIPREMVYRSRVWNLHRFTFCVQEVLNKLMALKIVNENNIKLNWKFFNQHKTVKSEIEEFTCFGLENGKKLQKQKQSIKLPWNMCWTWCCLLTVKLGHWKSQVNWKDNKFLKYYINSVGKLNWTDFLIKNFNKHFLFI